MSILSIGYFIGSVDEFGLCLYEMRNGNFNRKMMEVAMLATTIIRHFFSDLGNPQQHPQL
jgi:hypothetical protein